MVLLTWKHIAACARWTLHAECNAGNKEDEERKRA